MRKRFVVLLLITIALLLALFIKKCSQAGHAKAKPGKAASISPASIMPGKSIKRILAEKTAAGAKDYDMLVIRTDAEGKAQWIKAFGGADYDWIDYIVQCDDGAFLALGRTYYSADGDDDYHVMKIDGLGNSLWARVFAGRNENAGESVAQAVDAGYVITGKSFSGDGGKKEVFIAKTDREGNYEWVHNFGREYYEWGYSAVISPDGSYVIVGQDETPGLNADFYLRKRNNQGKYEWAKSYGGRDYDWGYGIAAAAGGYLLAGLTYSYGSGNDDLYIVKVDTEGGQVWDRHYGGPGYDEAFSICAGRNGSFAAAGATSSYGGGGYDAYVLGIDAKGNSLWAGVYGGTGNEAAYCINALKGGGYIIGGTTNSVFK